MEERKRGKGRKERDRIVVRKVGNATCIDNLAELLLTTYNQIAKKKRTFENILKFQR